MKKNSLLKQVLMILLVAANGLLMYFLPLIIQGLIVGAAYARASQDALLQSALLYYSFAVMCIVSILYFLINKYDRPILRLFGTKYSGNKPKFFLLGLLLGGGFNLICAVSAMLHGDITLFFSNLNILSLLIMFIGVFIQCAAEEIICRGYLYQRVLKLTGKPLVAILVNPVIFTSAHIFNPGVTPLALLSIFGVGVFLSIFIYFTDSLWFAFAFHTAWNFMQSCVLGLPNSGMLFPFSVYRLDTATARSSLFYDVGFGVEGTVFVCALFIIACVLLLLWGRGREKPACRIWESK